MERVGEHPVSPGPLAPRWLAYQLEPLRAGAVGRLRVAVENAGTATWYSHGAEGVQLSYHWLDPLGNPVVWDGARTALPGPVAPGESAELDVRVLAPRPPGRYVLSLDFVEELRFWFADVGCATLDLPADVGPLIAERRLAAVVHGGSDPATTAALGAQQEPLVNEAPEAVAHLVAGAEPAPDWSRRVLDAHAEGWPAVGPAVEAHGSWPARRRAAWLRPWAPGGGRNPRFGHPLLLPSLVSGLEADEHEGLPAWVGEGGLFEGRAVVRLRLRSGRRPG